MTNQYLHFRGVLRKLSGDRRQLLVPAIRDSVDALARLRTRPTIPTDDGAAVRLAGLFDT